MPDEPASVQPGATVFAVSPAHAGVHSWRARIGWALVIAGFLFAAVWYLHSQGRPLWCACGQPYLWAGDIHSSHNSQHVFDPYSFTHMLHGVLFFWLLTWVMPGMRWPWRLWIALAIEISWELVENSEMVIERYRTATIALGYEGDSIANNLGDVLSCALGFGLAAMLGLRGSIAVFAVTELCLVLWIRDSLTLSVLMLIHPWEALKAWQQGA